MVSKNHFTSKPPANRVAQLERIKAAGHHTGSAIIIAVAGACLLVALVIFLEMITTTPVF